MGAVPLRQKISAEMEKVSVFIYISSIHALTLLHAENDHFSSSGSALRVKATSPATIGSEGETSCSCSCTCTALISAMRLAI